MAVLLRQPVSRSVEMATLIVLPPAHGRGAGPPRREPEDIFVDQVEVPGVLEGAGRQAEGEVQHDLLSGRQRARQAMARLPFEEPGAPPLPAAPRLSASQAVSPRLTKRTLRRAMPEARSRVLSRTSIPASVRAPRSRVV